MEVEGDRRQGDGDDGAVEVVNEAGHEQQAGDGPGAGRRHGQARAGSWHKADSSAAAGSGSAAAD